MLVLACKLKKNPGVELHDKLSPPPVGSEVGNNFGKPQGPTRVREWHITS